MQTNGQSNTATLKTISHEVAHFWWNKGEDSWEDWLSESFAEFSTLLFLKKYVGNDLYNKQIEDYKKQTEGLDPIWGLDRSPDQASLILYYKGSVVLNDFMKYVGEEAFYKLLSEIHAKNINKTKDIISLINSTISEKAGNYLVELLQK